MFVGLSNSFGPKSVGGKTLSGKLSAPTRRITRTPKSSNSPPFEKSPTSEPSETQAVTRYAWAVTRYAWDL